ncbi:MAG: PAS domain-containing protein [Acidobacteria bacterium]|nr:PAS domain-containing protein [Acidobacteriota bacterium]
MLDRNALERQTADLHRTLDELRPLGPHERRLGSLIATDRIDYHGRYLFIDDCAEGILGYPPAYYEHEYDWVRLNHTFDIGRTARLWQAALSGHVSRGVEYRTGHISGHWVWLEDSFTPILTDSSGRALVIEGRWRDVTPRKRRETEFLIAQLESTYRTLKSPPLSGRTMVLRFPAFRPRGVGLGTGERRRP